MRLEPLNLSSLTRDLQKSKPYIFREAIVAFGIKIFLLLLVNHEIQSELGLVVSQFRLDLNQQGLLLPQLLFLLLCQKLERLKLFDSLAELLHELFGLRLPALCLKRFLIIFFPKKIF